MNSQLAGSEALERDTAHKDNHFSGKVPVQKTRLLGMLTTLSGRQRRSSSKFIPPRAMVMCSRYGPTT
jgi:hypothetical protein